MDKSERDLTSKEALKKEGDDTMSAVAQNCVYIVNGKKKGAGKEPTISEKRMEQIKATFDKYLSKNK